MGVVLHGGVVIGGQCTGIRVDLLVMWTLCKAWLCVCQDDGNHIIYRTLNLPILNVHQCTLLSNVLFLHLYKLIQHVMLMIQVDQQDARYRFQVILNTIANNFIHLCHHLIQVVNRTSNAL